MAIRDTARMTTITTAIITRMSKSFRLVLAVFSEGSDKKTFLLDENRVMKTGRHCDQPITFILNRMLKVTCCK